jgi:uncharacterized OB-fold protein
MTEHEYDGLRNRIRTDPRAYCATCRARTDFTILDDGTLFCISCGNEPEVKFDDEEPEEESQ